MSRDALLHDAILPLHGASAAAVAWRAKGQLQVTVIVKATFSFAVDAEMARAPAREIQRADAHHGDHPARSVRFASDLAPYLGAADVLLTGWAFAPPGGPARSLRVRLGIFDGARALIDKTVSLHDRAGIERMPLVYERSYGGMSVPENPLGVGADPGTAEPTIVDPTNPRRAVGLGPIARSWPARRSLLGATPRSVLDAPIAEIPDGFDWSYFQAAPVDQRATFLRGDEWIVMDGVHPTLPRVKMRLPGARGRARIHGLATSGVPEGQPLELNADTLQIDSELQICSVVWRGNFPVASEAALAEVRLVAGVELRSEPLIWPVPPERGPGGQRAPARMAPTAVLAPPEAAGTIAVSVEDELDGRAASALPFRPSAEASPLAQADADAPPPIKDRSGSGTVAALSDDDGSGLSGPVLPFHASAGLGYAPAEQLALPPIKDRSGAGTLAVSLDDDPPAPSSVLPFQAPSGASPFAQPDAAPPIKDRSGSGTIAAFVDDDEAQASTARALPFPAAVAPAPPPAAPPGLPAEPEAAAQPVLAPVPAATALPSSPWAPSPEPPPPPPAAPPPEPVRAAPALKRGLYGRFGGKR